MDQSSFQYGAQHAVMFGDNSALSSGPPNGNFLGNQTPLLNDMDQDFMSYFFENPDQVRDFRPSFDIGTGLSANENTHSTGGHWRESQSLSIHNPAVTLASSPSYRARVSLLNPQAGSSAVTSNRWMNGMHSTAMNNDDYNAASFLQNLKAGEVPQRSDNLDPSYFGQGSWGSFTGAPSMNMNISAGMYSSHAPSNQSYGPSGMGSSAQALQWQTQMSFAQTPHGPPQRNLSLDTSQMMQRQQLPGPFAQDPSSSPVRFGSDNSFSPHGYRPHFAAQHMNKDGNLLGVPFAHQAASTSPVSTPYDGLNHQSFKHNVANTMAGDSRIFPSAHSSLSDLGSLHTISPTGGGRTQQSNASSVHPSKRDQAHDPLGSRPNSKRRRRQGETEDDAEFVPAHGNFEDVMIKRDPSVVRAAGHLATTEPASAAPVKRRKSVTARAELSPPSSESPTAGGDDDAEDAPASSKKKSRVPKKARENLSESQKRQNHIQSEKKRRDIINSGYAELNKLVPALANGKAGLSRSESLQEVAISMEGLVVGNAHVMSLLGLSDLDEPLAGLGRFDGADPGDNDVED